MATPLMRENLRELYTAADKADPHAGLLLQRGWEAHAQEGAKADHVGRVCALAVNDFYRHAFRRWKDATADEQRFRQRTLSLESRLFIGTADGGALETGCAISHSHGMPYIPGSSVKGVVSAHARERFKSEGANDHVVCQELFGSGPNKRHPSGLAGLISFHDAWWVPGSAETPLVPEVVTSHHPDYYSKDGETRATDFDSPVPNAQVAVQGAFLFVMEGPCGWLGLAAEILTEASHTRGFGAKTHAGYGFFSTTPEATPARTWVDEAIAALVQENKAAPLEVLRGRQLAKRWAALEDAALKQAALQYIRARWEEESRRLSMPSWWERPPGKSTRDAKKIYLRGTADN